MRSTRERTLAALDLNAVSTQQWDEADRGYAAQAAVLRRVAAQLESIDVDIEKSRLLAPFAGVVARRFVDEGAVVSAGEPLLRLLEIGHPEVRIGISVALAKSLKVGDERLVRADGRELTAATRQSGAAMFLPPVLNTFNAAGRNPVRDSFACSLLPGTMMYGGRYAHWLP